MDATSEPVLIMPAPNNNTGPILQSETLPVPIQNNQPVQQPVIPESVDDKQSRVEKARLIRNIKNLLSDPDINEQLSNYTDLDVTSYSIEELKELKEEMEDTILSESSLFKITVQHTIKEFESLSNKYKAFPIKLQGLSDKLEIANPKSKINKQLSVISAGLDSGIRFSPWQRLIFNIGVVAREVHNENTCKEFTTIHNTLDKPVPENIEKELEGMIDDIDGDTKSVDMVIE